MSDFHQTEMDVIRWAEATYRLHTSPDQQATYVVDNVVDLCNAIANGKPVEISDAMGRVAIDMIVLCAMLDIDLTKCLEQAFARISAKPEKSNVVFLNQE